MTPKIATIGACDYVVFGGTGDLALRKLLPALYQRERDGQLPPVGRIIGVSRAPIGAAGYITRVEEGLHRHVAKSEFIPEIWERFRNRLDHIAIDVGGPGGWDELTDKLSENPDFVRMFYLATSPELFGPISQHLQDCGLNTDKARVVLEKPIGHDLDSARLINDRVGAVFRENQIFRIDHYLGKETVQNLMALRFANSLFEPLWNNHSIDHVQITVSETIGIEGRGAYYDHSGALRDMVQNHLMQLLCLVAMEPPLTLDKDAVRDEKLKVLRALKPITRDDVAHCMVRGQYRAGAVDGAAVRAYLEEDGIDPSSDTETFVALKVEVANWRWAGVPFYLRTGKRLQEKVSEIVIQFRPVPHSIFPSEGGELVANRLVVRLQPNEAIRMHLMAKEPGPGGMRLRQAPLNLSFAEAFKHRFPDAYERLLMDVVRGNPTLFMRRDEVESAWSWTEHLLDALAARPERPKPYIAGTWGPSNAIALIERDGRTWHEDSSFT